MNTLAVLFFSLLTIFCYAIALFVFRLARQFPLLHPLVIGSCLTAGLLVWQQTTYSDYLLNNRLLTMLLGPATVALAIPLHQQIRRVLDSSKPLMMTLLAGAVLVPFCGISMAWLLGGNAEILTAMLTKAVTTPVALGIAEQATGGQPALVAGIVVVCGIVAAIVAQPLFRLLKINDPRIQGITLGLNGHAIGTTRGFEISSTCGAFSSLALALNACITALLLPLILFLLA